MFWLLTQSQCLSLITLAHQFLRNCLPSSLQALRECLRLKLRRFPVFVCFVRDAAMRAYPSQVSSLLTYFTRHGGPSVVCLSGADRPSPNSRRLPNMRRSSGYDTSRPTGRSSFSGRRYEEEALARLLRFFTTYWSSACGRIVLHTGQVPVYSWTTPKATLRRQREGLGGLGGDKGGLFGWTRTRWH